ncbi:MAG TPA: 2-oxoglutarate dehydrogenase complex dihydrolipoyllysine-residue succinyltransferase [Anaerolineales bacterium]|nr:2-oxoglutarate dehydrogenase complex dihydrolipoyllysine-residue succinyltransferase [Anaerolineales bacterium]
MAIEITVPELGESVLEATVSRWLKKEGEFVSVGEVLVELETDKVNLEVGAKGAGVLQRIEAAEGADVKVGDVLGTIDEKATEQQTEQAQAASASESAAPEAERLKGSEERPEPAAEAQQEEPQTEEAPAGSDGQQMERQTAPQVSPVAARLARDKNVDISKIPGTGTEGRVTKADVEMFLQKQQTAPAAEKQPTPPRQQSQPEQVTRPQPAPGAPSADRQEERTRMSRRRRTIAQRLLEATQTTAMLTTFNEIDMSAVMDIRKRHNEEFQKRYGIKLGFMSFFVKASISALRAFPQVNAEIDGEELVFKHYYDIGMAVGSSEGLVVPVIRDADRLSFADIEQRINDFVEKTQEGKLSIEDLRGGTFTITNGGVFGSLLSTPILNPPQVGILGLHKIEERPIALNGQVVIRPMMYVALSYDHRIVDGREAVQFLVHIKQVIEDPAWMLVGG